MPGQSSGRATGQAAGESREITSHFVVPADSGGLNADYGGGRDDARGVVSYGSARSGSEDTTITIEGNGDESGGQVLMF